MNIINFTPLPAFIGGTIIGLAVVIFYLGNRFKKLYFINYRKYYKIDKVLNKC